MFLHAIICSNIQGGQVSLISILLIVTAVLAVSSGLLSLFGSSRGDRGRSAWLLVSNIGAVIWALSIGIYLALPATADSIASNVILGIYTGAMVMSTALLGHMSWKYIWGKVATVFFILWAVALAVLLVGDRGLLYTSYTLSNAGNTVELINGWYYWCYTIFFVLNISAFLFATYYHAKHANNKRVRNGDYILLGGLAISGALSATFDLFLPLMGRYDSIWVGPLSVSISMLAYFYAILKYRIISVSTGWLRVMAYVVVLTTGAAIYMLLFYIVFTALFKIPNPSASVLVLNFLMIVIVLLLMPVINEVNASVRSMIMVGQVDLAYVIRKLNRIATKNVDLRDLAGFLADHLHFAYVGFVINGRLYGSKALAVSSDELSKISHLRSVTSGVWQEPTKPVKEILDELDLKAVAELKNAKGKPFGQIIVGKPLGKSNFERRDLVQLEMIINLVAMVIDSEKHLRA